MPHDLPQAKRSHDMTRHWFST